MTADSKSKFDFVDNRIKGRKGQREKKREEKPATNSGME
jgi:hypothetical protein